MAKKQNPKPAENSAAGKDMGEINLLAQNGESATLEIVFSKSPYVSSTGKSTVHATGMVKLADGRRAQITVYKK